MRYTSVLKGFSVQRNIPIDYKDKEAGIKYGKIETLQEVAAMVNDRFFNKFLGGSYFGELPDKLKDEVISEALLRSREAFFAWFYKGNKVAIKRLFPEVAMMLIKNSIINGQWIRAKEQWLLKDAVISYLNGGNKQMGEQLQPILQDLENKIMGSKEAAVDSDIEYYCAVGQLAYYLLSHNKGTKRTHALINPILNCKEDAKLKEQLRKLFVKYNYDIVQGGKRFNRLYGMITGYTPSTTVIEDALLYGYLQDNLIYKKGDKEDE